MENEQKFRSHWTWIVSLLAFALFNVMLQYWWYHVWTGEGSRMLWGICSVGMLVLPPVGFYYGILFVFRNRHLTPPWRQMLMPLIGTFLVVGNLVCLGSVLWFLMMKGVIAIPKLLNDIFIKIFCF